MKTGLSLLIGVVLLTITSVGATAPLVVRCIGESTTTWEDLAAKEIQMRIDVVIPEKLDRLMTMLSEKGEHLGLVDPWPVGVGDIEITLSLRGQSQSSRHKFIVTRMPDSANALIGFYKTNAYIQTLRADLWEKAKPFVFFDALNKQVVSGHCQ
jgi:hypothetical protein